MIFDVLLALIFGVLLVVFFILFLNHLRKNTEVPEVTNDCQIIEDEIAKETKPKKNTKVWKRSKADTVFQFNHKWLVAVLKGHTANILDFDISSSGRHILSVASDRSLFLWKIKEIWQKERKIIRNNVNLDHATKIKFSPDDKACIVSLGVENTLRVMKIKKENNTYSFPSCTDFPKDISSEIINIGIASTGNYIMTCHANTTIGVWSLKGELLHTIDTGNMINYFGIVSPCGRFIASAGFSPDTRVWFVEFDKSKSFKQVTRAFELKGHNSAILELCFTHDSTKAATISKDSTWRLWNIDIDYKFQDPVLLKSGKYNYINGLLKVHISLSASGHCLCIAQNKDVCFIDTVSSNVVETMQDAHIDVITALSYEPKNKIFLSSGGKHINVYNDIVSREVEVKLLKEKLRKITDDKYQKQRLIDQIKDFELTLSSLLKNENQN